MNRNLSLTPEKLPFRSMDMKGARPVVLAEYGEKVARLQREKPLSEPAHGVVQRMLNEVLAA